MTRWCAWIGLAGNWRDRRPRESGRAVRQHASGRRKRRVAHGRRDLGNTREKTEQFRIQPTTDSTRLPANRAANHRFRLRSRRNRPNEHVAAPDGIVPRALSGRWPGRPDSR